MKKNIFLILFLLTSFIIVSCKMVPIIEMKDVKAMRSQFLVEDFESMLAGDSVSATSTSAVYLTGAKFPSLGWGLTQGPHAGNKLEAKVLKDGYHSYRSVELVWNNKNGVWQNFALWISTPPVVDGFSAFVFYVKLGPTAKEKKRVSFDVSLNVSVNGAKGTITKTTPKIILKKGEWQRIVLPIVRMNKPVWDKNSDLPDPEKIVKNGFKINAITLSPPWNSEGDVVIDNIAFIKTNIKPLEIKQKPRKRWKDLTSFVCYYGSGSVEEMSQFDVAIIEPSNQSSDNIKTLQKSGLYVIGYISVGESRTLDKGDGKGPGGYASYYFDADHDNKPDQNKSWLSYYANADSPLWQEKILNGVRHIVRDKGCDGVFLDTVDTVTLYPESENGMLNLIKKMKQMFPNIIIIQNRGLGIFKKTVNLVNGIMYEDFSINYNWQDGTYSKGSQDKLISTGKWAVDINKTRKGKNVQVFDLGYADLGQKDLIQFCYDRGWEYDFIPYVASIQLDQVYPKYTPHTKRGVKAFIGEGIDVTIKGDSSKLLSFDFLKRKNNPDNYALTYNGATIEADSIFGGYNPIFVIDGYTNNTKLIWNYIAWASMESDDDHWLKIKLKKSHKIKKVVIYWGWDNGKYYPSQLVKVQYMFQGYWKNLGAIWADDPNAHKSVLNVKTPEIGKEIRIFQPKGKGPKKRPLLMWISEIEIY